MAHKCAVSEPGKSHKNRARMTHIALKVRQKQSNMLIINTCMPLFILSLIQAQELTEWPMCTPRSIGIELRSQRKTSTQQSQRHIKNALELRMR